MVLYVTLHRIASLFITVLKFLLLTEALTITGVLQDFDSNLLMEQRLLRQAEKSVHSRTESSEKESGEAETLIRMEG